MESSAQIAVMLSGRKGDDQPGGGGMIPIGAVWGCSSACDEDVEDGLVEDEDRWTWTRGDSGCEVKMKDGNKAI